MAAVPANAAVAVAAVVAAVAGVLGMLAVKQGPLGLPPSLFRAQQESLAGVQKPQAAASTAAAAGAAAAVARWLQAAPAPRQTPQTLPHPEAVVRGSQKGQRGRRAR